MSVIECKPNSNKYKQEQLKKEERPKINKVVRGTVKRSKNSGSKLADVFISEDVSNVKNYILMDVIVPAVKKLYLMLLLMVSTCCFTVVMDVLMLIARQPRQFHTIVITEEMIIRELQIQCRLLDIVMTL